jgi:hypothetical protein
MEPPEQLDYLIKRKDTGIYLGQRGTESDSKEARSKGKWSQKSRNALRVAASAATSMALKVKRFSPWRPTEFSGYAFLICIPVIPRVNFYCSFPAFFKSLNVMLSSQIISVSFQSGSSS